MNRKLSYTSLLLTLISFRLVSQDLEKIGKKDMVTVNGGINLNTIYLNTNNPASKRDPFSWYAAGNLTIGMLGWSFPFSYQISNQSRTYSQPFNQYGVTPTYKWVKLYAGWSNVNFSQYTLSGYPFLGGGAELSPKNWKIIFLYGQFKKAVGYDFEKESDANMSYKRMGIGAKIGYEKNGYSAFGTIFKAKDYSNSLSYIPESTSLQPQEGTVISLQAKAPILKIFSINAEYALSGMTRNSLSEIREKDQIQNKYPPFLLQQRTTTEFFAAYKTSLAFTKKIFSISANYERIEPGYTTLGAFYFNNDFENVTLAPQLRLLKSKLNISLNGGLQRNNINNEKLNTTRRVIGSANISFAPNTHWLLNGSYSNFTSFTRNRPNTDPFYALTPADTLRFYQISQSGNFMTSYNFTKGDYRNSISLNGSTIISAQTMANTILPSTTVYNGNLSYAVSHTPSKFTISFTANANKTVGQNINNLFYGPGLNLSKPFFKNALTISAGSLFNAAYTNNVNNGMVFSERLMVNFKPKTKQTKYGRPNFGLSCNYVNKPKVVSNGFMLSEFTGNLTAGYSF
ncbi:MAG: hypothetical protein ABIP51_03995 [Bacteroidia bacterium]